MSSSGQSISVQKIAELAGTSVTTVSRIINQNGRYSKETEQRVRAVMREYHYQPNRLARSLRMQRSQIIGVLIPDITNQFFSAIVRELQNQLFEAGYLTLICNTNECPEEEDRQVRMLLGQQVDGIIYIGVRGVASPVDIPVVYIDRDPFAAKSREEQRDYVFIESDNEQGGYLAGQALLKSGVRTPAVVCFGKEFSTILGRVSGFRKACEESGISLREELFLSSEGDTLAAGAASAALIRTQHPDVDGIFFTSDMMAIGALDHLRRQGVRIPEDLHVIGFDGIAIGDIVRPTLTSVRQDVQTIGKLASQRILNLIRHEEVSERTIRVPVSLLQREST